jgi:hypothetical protein
MQDVGHQARLARAGDSRHHREGAERHGDVDILQVVVARAAHDESLTRARPPALRQLDRELAAQVAAGERGRMRRDLRRRARRHQLAAVQAGAGPQVEHPVGGADGLLVVLDDEHRVAEVAHLREGAQQARVVALVEPDRRLVQHVEHAHQLRADLGGEPDALALATRERCRRAVEREVADADVVEEAQPVTDLLQHLAGDGAIALGELETREDAAQLADRERRQPIDRFAGDGDGERLGPQPPPVAGVADLDRHVLLDLAAHELRIGFAVATLEHGQDALPLPLPRVGRLPALELEFELLLAAPLQDHPARPLRQPAPARGERELHRRGQRAQHLQPPGARAGLEERQGAGVDRALGIDHHLVGIDSHQRAEARAGRTGAVGTVEGEQPRRDLGQAGAAFGAGEMLRERLFGQPLRRRQHQAGAHLERGLERIGEPLLEPRTDHQAVDEHVDRMLLLLVERRRLAREIDDGAVDARPHEALARHLGELLLVLALLATHVGRVEMEPRPLGVSEQAVDHLLHRLRPDLLAARRAVRHADGGEEQPQVVVDLGHRAHRRARILGHRFLLDRDRRRQAFDRVDVGLLDLRQELPGVGRERLDVAPLPLGEEGVEGERRLPRPRHAGDHHQPVPGDLEVEVLEVVLARAADDDAVHGAEDSTSRPRTRPKEATAASLPHSVW